jgi:hypothetical protein
MQLRFEGPVRASKSGRKLPREPHIARVPLNGVLLPVQRIGRSDEIHQGFHPPEKRLLNV